KRGENESATRPSTWRSVGGWHGYRSYGLGWLSSAGSLISIVVLSGPGTNGTKYKSNSVAPAPSFGRTHVRTGAYQTAPVLSEMSCQSTDGIFEQAASLSWR